MEKVIFEPHNASWIKVTAVYRDARDNKVVYLDHVSAKTFLQNAMWHGQAQPKTDFKV